MKKVRPVVARNGRELAKVLGLTPADEMEIEFRSGLNDKIIEVVGKKGLTYKNHWFRATERADSSSKIHDARFSDKFRRSRYRKSRNGLPSSQRLRQSP